jgi:rod shape-determining protein MreC
VIAAVLVAISLALVTISFRGGLSGLESAGSSVLYPFEVAAERVARPFRDAASWFSSLLHARSQNTKLRAEVDRLRQRANQNQAAVQENKELKRLLGYLEGPAFPSGYTAVAARIISRAPSQFEQRVGIAAGAAQGIALNDPVVTADGLVGSVTRVFSRASQVTLLTDDSSAVSGIDLKTRAGGIVRHGRSSDSQVLVLDRVDKKLVVNLGDVISTAGWKSGTLASLYPKGIPIGRVTSSSQTDTDLFKQVVLQPFVDADAIDAVLVLVPKKRS